MCVYILFYPLSLLLFMMNVRGDTVSFSKLWVFPFAEYKQYLTQGSVVIEFIFSVSLHCIHIKC